MKFLGVICIIRLHILWRKVWCYSEKKDPCLPSTVTRDFMTKSFFEVRGACKNFSHFRENPFGESVYISTRIIHINDYTNRAVNKDIKWNYIDRKVSKNPLKNLWFMYKEIHWKLFFGYREKTFCEIEEYNMSLESWSRCI